MDKRCIATVYNPGSFSRRSCERAAKQDGFCSQHHPEAEKARSDKRRAEWESKYAAQKARETRQQMLMDIGQAVLDAYCETVGATEETVTADEVIMWGSR